ncbi:MAG: cysteine desulfurase-like protein [Pirellulaceae bacterium]
MDLVDYNVQQLRKEFPALSRKASGREAVFFDGPAGTQVPNRVIGAISSYLSNCNANGHGEFATSRESDAGLESAHQAAADFVGADDPDCIAFGSNMTTLTLALARSFARIWKPGDEIVLSGIEHDANFTPWHQAAEDSGATIHVIDVRSEDCTLDMDDFKAKLNERTKFVAVGCASNAAGTVNPVAEICAEAKKVGALTFLDAVHYAPHDAIDVKKFDCDFLACSAYKFFGPHIGILWGRRELLESMEPYKLRPSPNALPGRWMTGTQNHECIMGTKACIEYIAGIGRMLAGDAELGRRRSLEVAFEGIRRYESGLCDRLLDGLAELPEIKVWGITDAADRGQRFPTVSITHSKFKSQELAKLLGEKGIFVWHGNYYALPLTERIGVEPDGMVRIGLVHYNTREEVDYFLEQLSAL